MSPAKLKPYSKDLEVAYSFGNFPTLELLSTELNRVICVIVGTTIHMGEGFQKLCDLCAAANIEILISDQLLHRLSPRESCDAIGAFRKYTKVLDRESNHIVLVNPSNMGNLGTILRTAVGFGFKDIAIIRQGVDIFDPRVVRASMGAIFRTSFSYFDDIQDYLHAFDNHRVYSFMVHGKRALTLSPVERSARPYSLVFGNEATGLGDEYHSFGETVYIPHHESIDSLNLAIAVGIACFTTYSGRDDTR